jgi:hypothetical protein
MCDESTEVLCSLIPNIDIIIKKYANQHAVQNFSVDSYLKTEITLDNNNILPILPVKAISKEESSIVK